MWPQFKKTEIIGSQINNSDYFTMATATSTTMKQISRKIKRHKKLARRYYSLYRAHSRAAGDFGDELYIIEENFTGDIAGLRQDPAYLEALNWRNQHLEDFQKYFDMHKYHTGVIEELNAQKVQL